MIPTPKFEMGQTVYYPTTTEDSKRLPCPDCKDTRKWTITTPAGDSFETACQRCPDNYRRVDETPSLFHRVWHPSVKSLTVGQIKIETPRPSWERDEVQYMCVETGVGSGSVYGQSKLYATEEEARAAAEADARKQQAEWDAKPANVRPRETATLRLSDALGESARHTIWTVSYHSRQLRLKVEEWLEGDDFNPTDEQRDLIHEAIRDLEWHDKPEQNPLMGLVLAAREAAAAHPGTRLTTALSAFDFIRELKAEEVLL